MEEYRRKHQLQQHAARYQQHLEQRRAKARQQVSQSPHLILGTFGQYVTQFYGKSGQEQGGAVLRGGRGGIPRIRPGAGRHQAQVGGWLAFRKYEMAGTWEVYWLRALVGLQVGGVGWCSPSWN